MGDVMWWLDKVVWVVHQLLRLLSASWFLDPGCFRIQMYAAWMLDACVGNGLCNAKSNETCFKQFVLNIELST